MKIILPGATGQFGEALLLRMLTEGHTVFGFARDQEKIKKTLERISNALPNVITEKKLMIISADIADETLAKRAVEWLGGCDMYVNNVGIFKFDDKLSPSGISEDMLIQTNVHANKKFLNQIIIENEKYDLPLIIADVGSIGAIDQMSIQKFTLTVTYNKSKATLVEDDIELVKRNLKLKLRVAHLGPFGESAQEIANHEKIGDTWATSPQDMATFAMKIFFEKTDKRVTHGIAASENHFCWGEEYFGDIEKLGIEGLTWARSWKVPADPEFHLFRKAA